MNEDTMFNERDIDAIQTWLRRETSNVFMVGIGGVGMAGLANLLAQRGLTVTGSDCCVNSLTDWLSKTDIRIHNHHEAKHIDETIQWAIRTTAVKHDHVEIQACRAQGCPVFMRGAVLAALAREYKTIAVTGTHGKTSTTAMIAHVLNHAGYFIGGEMTNHPVSDRGDGTLFVTEADESDGTVSLYAPDTALITNIEYDHMEHFDSREQMEQCFEQLIAQTHRHIIYCADDSTATRLCLGKEKATSYGLIQPAYIYGKVLNNSLGKTIFNLFRDGILLGEVILPIHGLHNIINAIGTFAAVMNYGISFREYADAMAVFQSVKRRFECCGTCQSARVISDYAHHPTEIKAVLEAASNMPHDRIICIFQPHRYTRTLALKHHFSEAFRGADTVILSPVYPASESPLPGGTSEDLFNVLNQDAPCRILLASSLNDAWNRAKAEIKGNDILLLLGAGDIDKLARDATVQS